MSTRNLTTKPYPDHRALQALRQEAGAAHRRKAVAEEVRFAVTCNIEDAIFSRLCEAEELLTVATGLFAELAAVESNWLFDHQQEITDARGALREIIDDRP